MFTIKYYHRGYSAIKTIQMEKLSYIDICARAPNVIWSCIRIFFGGSEIRQRDIYNVQDKAEAERMDLSSIPS